MLWRKILHYSLSFKLRGELYCELDHARRQGFPLPDAINRGVWKAPHHYEDFIRFLRFLDPRKKHHAIDVGANVGNWTGEFLRFFPKSTMTCMEPVPATFAKLQSRYANLPNVRPINAAASSAAGTSEMIVDEGSERSSLQQYDDTKDQNIRIREKVPVKLARIDAIELDPEADMKLLKVDVQGHEIEALRGAEKLLPKIDVCIVECTFNVEYAGLAPSFSDVCAILKNANLLPFHFRQFGRHLSPYAWERDVIFARQPLLERLWGW